MMDKSLEMQIRELEERIAALPIGYVSKKNIKGKIRYYRQWGESGKTKSEYLKQGEVEKVSAAIEERKALTEQLRALKRDNSVYTSTRQSLDEYETNVMLGDSLRDMCHSRIIGYGKRDCFSLIDKYLKSDTDGKVCVVYGLRRTGKTVMLLQAINELPIDKTVYIKATVNDTIGKLNGDIKKLVTNGYKYIFLDEITLIEDFIDSAAVFSDIYAMMGIKIVMSGTDSLGFWFASHEELYDRAYTIHTTFIPFREHSRLLDIHDIDEYIRYGGTLKAGIVIHGEPTIDVEEASFRDDETTRVYIDTAICKNIQHSLMCCEDGGHFRHLKELYQAGELTSAINRIIEDMNHEFVLNVLIKDFRSGDLRLAKKNLAKETNPDFQSDALEHIDEQSVVERLRHTLNIKNSDELTVKPEAIHVAEIKEYLQALDLITSCPYETIPYDKPIDHTLITQPGMRYCQAEALVDSLMEDEMFALLTEREKTMVCNRILNDVRGRMLEDIVLLETSKAANKNQRVFKLQFSAGEFDMVIYDAETFDCSVYEIKHSTECIEQQTRHLRDQENISKTEHRFGRINTKTVLYRGKSISDDGNGIQYLNVEEFLTNLPNSITGGTHTRKPKDGEFAEQILADLIAKGYSGDDLQTEFRKALKNVRPAVEAMISEADKVASGKNNDVSSYNDVFNPDDK